MKLLKKNTPVSPYVGLVPFEEKNFRYFFGREKDIQIAAMNLQAANITIFYGASGVGKSSLINAGILPYLQNAAEFSIIPGKMPEFVLIVLRDWVNDKMESLRRIIDTAVWTAYKQALEKAGDKQLLIKIDGQESPLAEEIEKRIAENKENNDLYGLLKGWTELLKVNFLVIFDQFEVFLAKAESNPSLKTDEDSFAAQFSEVINKTDLPVNFMISLRDDALAQLDFLKNKTPGLMKNTLRLEHLNLEAAEDAIKKPLERYNRDNDNETQYDIEPDLVKILLKELRVGNINFDASADGAAAAAGQNEPVNSADRIETPFLQLVMTRLWQEVKGKEGKENQLIRSATLDALKGTDEPNPVRNIIKTYLDEVMRGFTEAQRIYTSKFIHFTVSASGAKRSSTVEELADYTDGEVSQGEIERIMQNLAGDKRVFKRVENRANKNKPFYEVTHDALVPAILSWREREHGKIEQDEKLAEEDKIRLEQKAKLEDQERRLIEAQQLRSIQERLLAEEQRGRKRGRIYVTVIALLSLIVGIVGIAVIYNRVIIKQQTLDLEQQRQILEKEKLDLEKGKLQGDQQQLAENENKSSKIYKDVVNKDIIIYTSLIDILIGLHSEKPGEVDQALKKLQDKAKNNALPEEYKDRIINILSNKSIAPHDQKNLEETQELVKNSTTAMSNPPVVFIQFQIEDDRSKARSLRNLLNNNGFLSPGIENVGSHPEIKQIELRYFHDNDKEVMNRVLDFLRKNYIDVVPHRITGYETSPQVRPNQFELWFTGDGIPNTNATTAN